MAKVVAVEHVKSIPTGSGQHRILSNRHRMDSRAIVCLDIDSFARFKKDNVFQTCRFVRKNTAATASSRKDLYTFSLYLCMSELVLD